MATINPTGIGQTIYTITASNRALADLSLSFSFGTQYQAFRVAYPTAAAGVQITLVSPALPGGLALLPGPIVNNTSFPNRILNTTSNVVGPNTELSVLLQTTVGDAAAEPYTVKLEAGAAIDWTFRQDDNDPGLPTVTRLMCDPVAQITSVVPAAPKEKDSVTLTAAPGVAVGTVVAAVPPTLTYRWSYTGTIVVAGFPTQGPSPTKVFTAPGVYGPRSITAQLEVWPDWDAGTTGQFLTRTASSPVTIDPTAQHLMLVLDRSGSMSGSRWQTAVVAARILAQMYMALRKGVSNKDRVGILVFEDTTCSWHAYFTPSPAIALGLALGAPEGGNDPASMCSLDLGTPGACTPIGDALLKAMWHLQPLYDPADKPRFHIVLLTDGYENSGSVYLKSTPSAVAAGAASFASKKGTTVDGRDLSVLNNRHAIYPIGLGATVDDQVLNELSWGTSGMPTVYRNVLDVSQIKAAISDMIAFSQEAQAVASATSTAALSALVGVSVPADPAPPANARYLLLEPKVNRAVLAVEWPAGAHALQVARWDGATYAAVATDVALCTEHGFTSVDVASLYGGEDLVPQSFWRVVRQDGGVATAIADDDFLCYADLHVKADIRFDKREYRTGEEMVVRAALRQGSEPIRGATITVELARPGESLGTFLATNSGSYKPGSRKSPDPPPAKEDMLRQLLKQKEKQDLSEPSPPSIFKDGSNRLFDDGAHADGAAGDGDYGNVYAKVDKEGVYTFRFFVRGVLPDGSGFTRVIVMSTWCGIRVHPDASPVTFTVIGNTGALVRTLVKVVPRDHNGEYLGPFREDEVKFKTSAGTLLDAVKSEYDGSYTQVLTHRADERPVVTVNVQGKDFPPRPARPETPATRLCDALRRLCRCFGQACECWNERKR